MADTKITALTANTTPAITDILPMVDDPGGTPSTQKIALSDFFKVINGLTADAAPDSTADYVVTYDASASAAKKVLLSYLGGTYGYFYGEDGTILNGKLSVTVASNNLTVALKTLAGSDPSSTDPVYIRIGDTIRSVTGALSVTKNAGTNWFNSGSSGLATKEIDYFVYLIWNTTPATDVIDIGFSRIPYGSVYSDFSGTSTNEKYLANGNASAPTSTDNLVNIGRFAATLSAGAGYTWTVPTFTSVNLIQRPIFETRWLSWDPTWSGSGSMTVTGVTVSHAKYQISMENCNCDIVATAFTIGGTPSTVIYMTLPFSSALNDRPLMSAAILQDSGGIDMGYLRNDATVTKAGFVKRAGANFAAGAGTFINANGPYVI